MVNNTPTGILQKLHRLKINVLVWGRGEENESGMGMVIQKPAPPRPIAIPMHVPHANVLSLVLSYMRPR